MMMGESVSRKCLLVGIMSKYPAFTLRDAALSLSLCTEKYHSLINCNLTVLVKMSRPVITDF